MSTRAKKTVPSLVLRTARQRLGGCLPTEARQLQWYLCPAENICLHLVLLDGQLPLARWVLLLPQACPAAPALPTGLWVQVPPALPVAAPAPAQAVGHGTCRLVGRARRAAALAPGARQPGRLLLHLPATDPAGRYTLTQLQPGSQCWLLSPVANPSAA